MRLWTFWGLGDPPPAQYVWDLILEVAEQLGYGDRLKLVLNRADSAFGIRVADVENSVGRKIDHQNHPDLHVLEPDGNSIKIEQVRSLQKGLNLKPLEANRKICLIEEAESMTLGAANALLKTLEEPRGDTLLILLTAYPNRLLETIRSRCQPLPFTRHPNSRIQAELEKQLDIDPTESHVLAALSEGSFKKAFGKDRELYLEERRKLLKTLTGLSPGSILPILDFAEQIAADKTVLSDIMEIF